jgi:hypothetical protein
MDNHYLDTNRKKFIRRSLMFISIMFFAIMISCTQKYDETGIFDAQDPNFSADTLTTIAMKNTIINSLDLIQDDYLYLGADIAAGDTSAYGEILFNFELFNTDSTLDSAYIIMPVFRDSTNDFNYAKSFEIFKVNEPWEISNLNKELVNMSPYSTNFFVDNMDSSLAYDKHIRIDIDTDSLMSWFTDDSLNYNFNGFYIRSTDGNEITPILKLYSSRWDYATYTPKIHRFRTDTLIAYDGVTDSLFVAETTNNLSTDLSFVKKESACLDTIDSKFKIGGISGEGIVCKIELDTIPLNATVITGRFEIDNDSSDPTLIDPIYGDIRNNGTDNELCIYKVMNSDWESDITLLKYDSANVWTYKIEPLETTTLMVADGMMHTE